MESRVPTAAARNEGVTGPFALPERAWASRPPDRASNVLLPLSAHRAGEIVTLLSPQIIDQSGDQDEQHEGCLSFFDVRGTVPWPLRIQVEHDSFQSNCHPVTPRDTPPPPTALLRLGGHTGAASAGEGCRAGLKPEGAVQ